MPHKVTLRDLKKSFSQLSRELRMRLSEDLSKPISQQKFSELLGVSWSTVARWEEKRSCPEKKMTGKIVELHLMLLMMEDNGFLPRSDRFKFFHEPNSRLMEMRPIDVLGMYNGEQVVMKILK